MQNTVVQLFGNLDIGAFISSKEKEIPAAVEALVDTEEPELAAAIRDLAEKLKINPLHLIVDETAETHKTVEIDDPALKFSSNTGFVKAKRKAFEYKFYVPFDGDSVLWKYGPAQMPVALPVAEVAKDEGVVVLTVVRPASDGPDAFKQEFVSRVLQIQTILTNQAASIESYNRLVHSLVDKAVEARRKEIAQANSHAAQMGFRPYVPRGRKV